MGLLTNKVFSVKMSFKAVLTAVIFLFITGAAVFAQAEEEEKESVPFKERIAPLVEKYEPRAGLRAGLLIPIGDIGDVMDNGPAFNLLFDILIPVFEDNDALDYRAGLSFGYCSFGTDVKAGVTLISFMLNNEIGYTLDAGVRPYFKLGLGMGMLSLDDEAGWGRDTSSTPLIVSLSPGVSYRHDSLYQVEFFLETGYMMVFEDTRGDFIDISLGVTYHFKKGERDETSE